MRMVHVSAIPRTYDDSMPAPPPRLCTLKEAAETIDVSMAIVRRLIDKGHIRCVFLGKGFNLWRPYREDVEGLVGVDVWRLLEQATRTTLVPAIAEGDLAAEIATLRSEVRALREEVAILKDLVTIKVRPRRAVTDSKRARIIARDGMRCRYTGVRLNKHTLTIDHIVPVVRGGSDDDINLVVCAKSVNYSKNDLFVTEAGLRLLPCPNGDDELNRIQQELAQGKV